MKKFLLLGVALLIVVGGIGAWYLYAAGGQKTEFRTAKAERADMVATISATGTIEPEETVDVGAQVAGIIQEFGPDPRDSTRPVDYGSPVDKNTILAKIDDRLYQTAVDQAQANLGQAEASVQQAQAKLDAAKADLMTAQANAELAQATLDLDQKGGKSITQLQLKQDVATAATTKAAVNSAQAAIPGAAAALLQAQKAVDTARANLKQAQINLGYCTIVSPVKGVVIDRRVNIGQTVVSSLNTPSLFLLAKDLKRMQVWASVNEADIGNIHPGQTVNFTVDAHPNEKFKGVVAPDQPRLNATMTQNVVTYTVVVNTDNSSGRLLPYLTANLEFEVDRHPKALRVPNAALRWQPQPQQVAPEARDQFLKALRRQSGAVVQGDNAPPPPDKENQNRGKVWVQDDKGFLRPIKVKIGLSDGINTEIIGGDLQEGADVVVGEVHQDNGGGGTSNPFLPSLFNRRKPQS